MRRGGETLWQKALKHARPRLFRWIVFCKELSDEFPDVPNPAGVRIERYDYSDFDRVCAQMDDPDCREYLNQGRNGSHDCYLAYMGDRIAGMTFISRTAVRVRRRHVMRLGPEERYAGNSFVLPAFRGKKIFHHLKIVSYRDQAAAGVQRIYNMVEPGNVASIRTHKNLGAVPIFSFSILAWMLLNLRGPRRAVRL